jgi:hypothetical protein
MGLIENKEVYKEFEKQENDLNSRFPYETKFPNYEIRQIKCMKWQEEKDLLYKMFKDRLKEIYTGLDDDIILFAEKLKKEGDWGFLFKKLELYIVLILNFLENRKVK